MNTSSPLDENPPRNTPHPPEHWLEVVERQVTALNYGSVHITVHEGRVVQIETSVRVRFDKVP